MDIRNQQGETPIVKSTDQARAGVTGHNVRYVLGFALAGAVVVFAALGLYFGFGGSSRSAEFCR